ncbi:SMI1/KNR4 family protein [Nannocystaceae bacterium ST9]
MPRTDLEILDQALADIEEWMNDEGAASFVAKLRPGASEAALDAAERSFDLPLLPSLKALYRRHDGQSGEVEPFFEHMFFVRLDEACRLRSVLLDCYFVPPAGMALRDYHVAHPDLDDRELSSRAWFPFANSEGDFLAVNLESGRVVRVRKGDCPWIHVAADDLAGFVSDYASGLWDGHYQLVGDLEAPGVVDEGLIRLSRYFVRA